MASQVPSGHCFLGTKHMPSTQNATELKKLHFASGLKHLKLLKTTLYPTLFFLIFLSLDIFLVSSTGFKAFIRLKKGEEYKKK